VSWELDPVVLAGAAVTLALCAQGWLRLRRRGRTDLAGAGRAVLFLLGVTIATVALVSPLDELGEERSLAAHMLQHVAVGDVAPALLVVAIRGPLVFFVLPAAVARFVARRRGLRRGLGTLLDPRAAFAVWALALGLWHVPAAYDYALAHPLAHRLEHLSFALGATLAWLQLVDPARRGALDRAGRLSFAVCMFAATAVLSGVLLGSGSVLYPSYADVSEPLFALSPLRDQALAGLVMLAESTLALGACTAALLGTRASARTPIRVAPLVQRHALKEHT
jgi:cytochrome c oxidase assembly factor CtaG